MPPLNFLNISVLVLYFDWCDNFHFVKNPVMLHEYVFVLIPDMGYGAVSNCPQWIIMSVSCYRRGMIFFQLQTVFVWNSWESWEGICVRSPRCPVVAPALPAAVSPLCCCTCSWFCYWWIIVWLSCLTSG